MRRKDDFLMHEVDGESLIVPLGSQVVDMNGLITMNSTGSFIWDLLEQDLSESQLLAAVIEQFDIDSARASADIRIFLDEISCMGLIET